MKALSAKQVRSSFVNAIDRFKACRNHAHWKGPHALVHTAAASALGQMLNRICVAQGVNVVNIGGESQQADIL